LRPEEFRNFGAPGARRDTLSHLHGVIRTDRDGQEAGGLTQECKTGRGQHPGISARKGERISLRLPRGGQIRKKEADGSDCD